jgi:hypothetical protein
LVSPTLESVSEEWPRCIVGSFETDQSPPHLASAHTFTHADIATRPLGERRAKFRFDEI